MKKSTQRSIANVGPVDVSIVGDMHFGRQAAFAERMAEIDVWTRKVISYQKDLVQTGPLVVPLKKIRLARQLREQLPELIRTDWDSLRVQFGSHSFSPCIELFERRVKASDFRMIDYHPYSVSGFERFVNELCHVAREENIRQSIKSRQHAVSANMRSQLKYVKQIYETYGYISTVRMILGFETGRFSTFGDESPLGTTKKVMAHFIKDCKRRYPQIVGFARKLDHGWNGSFYYHVFFYFRQRDVRDDVGAAWWLGERWMEAAKKGGKFVICYLDGQHVPVDVVTRGDRVYPPALKQRSLLEKSLKHLINIDWYVRTNLPPKTKAFSHGEIASDNTEPTFKEGMSRLMKNMASPFKKI